VSDTTTDCAKTAGEIIKINFVYEESFETPLLS